MKILNFLIIFLITYSNTVFAISKNDFIPDKAFKYNDENPDKVLKIVLTF